MVKLKKVISTFVLGLKAGLARLRTACVCQAAALRIRGRDIRKVDMCCGPLKVPGFFGVDFCGSPDLRLDLSRHDLPFANNSLDVVICMSAINYFSRRRAQALVRQVYRVLRPGGITRFGVQDMEAIAKRYVEKDTAFFFQKLPNGADRFEGPTLGDKFAAWFYGYAIKGRPCQYAYDYESLASSFREAGFSVVERKAFRESRLADVERIDNRPEQMFFLEAIK